MNVGLEVGDDLVHDLGVPSERFGAPIEGIGQDAQTEGSSSLEEKWVDWI